jgi:hypothetical protein
MHIQEKQAWFILIVSVVALALVALLVAILGPSPAVMGAFGFFGFAGFAGMIGNRERKAGMVVMDERDRQIALSATTGAFSVAWVLFVLTAMGPFVILGPDATLTLRTTTISSILVPGMIVLFVTRSLIVIVLYRRGCRA